MMDDLWKQKWHSSFFWGEHFGYAKSSRVQGMATPLIFSYFTCEKFQSRFETESGTCRILGSNFQGENHKRDTGKSSNRAWCSKLATELANRGA